MSFTMAGEKKNKSLLRRVLGSKILIFLEIIIVVFISLALGKEIIRRHQVQSEIKSLKNEIARLEAKKIELNDLIKYFESQSFKEEQARVKLGMQKEGESVVVVPENQDQRGIAGIQEEAVNKEGKKVSNPQKWWNYFFIKNI